MARNGREIGFSPDTIVKTEKIKQHEVSQNGVNSKDVIGKIKGETVEKSKMFIYLDPDIAFKVKEYGKQIGKNAGGNSRIIEEALKEFFKKYHL